MSTLIPESGSFLVQLTALQHSYLQSLKTGIHSTQNHTCAPTSSRRQQCSVTSKMRIAVCTDDVYYLPNLKLCGGLLTVNGWFKEFPLLFCRIQIHARQAWIKSVLCRRLHLQTHCISYTGTSIWRSLPKAAWEASTLSHYSNLVNSWLRTLNMIDIIAVSLTHTTYVIKFKFHTTVCSLWTLVGSGASSGPHATTGHPTYSSYIRGCSCIFSNLDWFLFPSYLSGAPRTVAHRAKGPPRVNKITNTHRLQCSPAL